MRYFIALASICVALLFALETQFLADFRQQHAPGVVNETFVRDGRLGKILRKNDLVSISKQTHARAIADECAETEKIENGDFHNQFKLLFRVDTNPSIHISVTVAVGKVGQQIIERADFKLSPDREFEEFYFRATQGEDIYIKYAIPANMHANLIEATIEARFNQHKQPIVRNGLPIQSAFYSVNSQLEFSPSKTGSTLLRGAAPEVTQIIKSGIRKELYVDNFPNNNSGYCTYTTKPYTPDIGPLANISRPLLLPKVNITADESDLYGEAGIFDNKQNKGQLWEKPATLSVINQHSISNLKVGLRFHGGTPGRNKKVKSYRIYARKRFGIATIDAQAILGVPTQTDFKTLVFKYTIQSLRTQDIDFNPFIHSLALDIADKIGAIVPRHQLVDFSLNGKYQGLYLAMEHLSGRTVENWLGHRDFTLYSYKSHNLLGQSVPVFTIIKSILNENGEQTLAKLEKHMDINNVLNSIMLSAYIGDDDYCQGAEIITERDSASFMTSINWDLDHGFMSLIDDKPSIDPKKYAFRIIDIKKSACIRQWMYGWTYLNSATFRHLVRDRMESLLDNQLHPERVIALLDTYKTLNTVEFSNRYDRAISDLQSFLERRAEIMRQQLKQLETRVDNIQSKSVYWSP